MSGLEGQDEETEAEFGAELSASVTRCRPPLSVGSRCESRRKDEIGAEHEDVAEIQRRGVLARAVLTSFAQSHCARGARRWSPSRRGGGGFPRRLRVGVTFLTTPVVEEEEEEETLSDARGEESIDLSWSASCRYVSV